MIPFDRVSVFPLLIHIDLFQLILSFGPNFTNVVKIFQEFDRSPTVNTGKVNLTRFSETFGVFSSLFVTFCF